MAQADVHALCASWTSLRSIIETEQDDGRVADLADQVWTTERRILETRAETPAAIAAKLAVALGLAAPDHDDRIARVVRSAQLDVLALVA